MKEMKKRMIRMRKFMLLMLSLSVLAQLTGCMGMMHGM